jgi:flagellar protein FliS
MNAYQVYRQTQTQTAAPGELVLMLYRGAVRFLGMAIDAIQNKDIANAHNNLVKVQDILEELDRILDLERGGDMATNLHKLYEYMIRRLALANSRKDSDIVREVQGLLRELLPAWEAAVRQTAAASGTLAGAVR